jgi:hypothetical protein
MAHWIAKPQTSTPSQHKKKDLRNASELVFFLSKAYRACTKRDIKNNFKEHARLMK